MRDVELGTIGAPSPHSALRVFLRVCSLILANRTTSINTRLLGVDVCLAIGLHHPSVDVPYTESRYALVLSRSPHTECTQTDLRIPRPIDSIAPSDLQSGSNPNWSAARARPFPACPEVGSLKSQIHRRLQFNASSFATMHPTTSAATLFVANTRPKWWAPELLISANPRADSLRPIVQESAFWRNPVLGSSVVRMSISKR